MNTFRIIDSHLSLEYLKQYKKGDIFIETGTYRGDTVYIALEADFDRIYSCEIYKGLFDAAVELFKENSKVIIKEMESPEFIKYVLQNIALDDKVGYPITHLPCTFWLDAHASGPLGGGSSVGTPLLDELKAIRDFSNNKEHTILIDDKRLFGCGEWGGVKLDDAMKLIYEINPDYKIVYLDGVIEKDIICAYTS